MNIHCIRVPIVGVITAVLTTAGRTCNATSPSVQDIETCLQGPSVSITGECAAVDANRDGKVDLRDAAVFLVTSSDPCAAPVAGGHFHFGVGKTRANNGIIWGAAADIGYFVPELCDEPTSTQQSTVCFWISAALEDAVTTRWAQIGWARQRSLRGSSASDPETDPVTVVYFEVKGGLVIQDPDDYSMDWFPVVPSLGEYTNYGVQYIDDSTGEWWAIYDGAPFWSSVVPSWISLQPDSVEAMLESFQWGSQLGGAPLDSSCINNCTWDINAAGSAIPITFDPSDFHHSSLPSLAPIVPTHDGFCVYDLRLQSLYR